MPAQSRQGTLRSLALTRLNWPASRLGNAFTDSDYETSIRLGL